MAKWCRQLATGAEFAYIVDNRRFQRAMNPSRDFSCDCSREGYTFYDSSKRASEMGSLLLFFVIAQAAHIVALGNALRQIQNTAVTLADAVVAAHGDIAKLGDLLVGAARVLPGFHKGTVVEIDRELIVGGFQDLHFKNKLCGLCKERFSQTDQAVGLALFHEIRALGKSTPLYGGTSEISRV